MDNRYFLRNIILIFLLGLFNLAGLTQSKPVVAASVGNAEISVNRTRILIGEQLELTLKLEMLSGISAIQWPVLPDSLGHFEVLNRSQTDSERSGNIITYHQVLILTSFDSGHWVIPAVSFIAGKKVIRTDSLAVDVSTIVLKGADYNDIKEIIEVPAPGFDWKKWLPYIIGTVLLIALIIYWWTNRKKKPVVEKPVSRSTAYEEAIAELKKLKAEQLSEKGEGKQFYSRLYDIFRTYFGRYSNTRSMQSTTDDLLLKMKDQVPSSSFSRVAEVLRISDAVKFAKYSSSVAESSQSWETIHNSVEEINRQKA